ncbi:MAG: M15 family metallopeptidase [Oscillospiraceae bacterium]|nr:M15 family metallopeptidase [Oscillospiraceae bacterium]
MLNSRDIALLRADVAVNCRTWQGLCRDAGLDVLITCTVRDKEYQAYLYAQGRTRPGGIVTNSAVPTFHKAGVGLAFDFCKNVKGHEYDDVSFFERTAAIAKRMGFTWGGDWESFPDRPHIQWDCGGLYGGADIRAGRIPPPMPRYEEDEDMTQEAFNAHMDAYLVQLGKKEPSAWSADARTWAEEMGLIVGDECGEKQYKAFVTREQMAVFLQRLAKTL